MKRFVLITVFLLLCASLSAAAMAGYLSYWFSAPGPLPEDKVIEIAPGSGFAAISETLKREGAIDHPLWFKAMAVWRGDQARFKAGEYQVPATFSPRKIMEMMVRGDVIVHRVTIPEGLTVAQIAALLDAESLLNGAVPDGIAEGRLMPDTYQFRKGDSRDSILKRMESAMQAALTEQWPRRRSDLPLRSPEEALVLASIVEKETGITEERGRVASVFINRLEVGMPLQSDPTVVYGLEKEEGTPIRILTREDLGVDHPYNTYRHTGLPPGPICNPGRAALAAVLNPPSTNDLYFVATGNGGHYFASNLREHNANVARYRKALQEQKAAHE